eukprot:gene75-101_t
MRYYIIAGEKSGDLHGSRLVMALKQRDPAAVLRGWGGRLMQQAGLELALHDGQVAVMGLGFLRHLVKIYGYFKQCKQDIQQFKPDVLILIDYAGFNLRMAKFAKEHHIKTIYYIAPKLWAWNERRLTKIKAYVDHMLVIFPFETTFYKKQGYHQVTYVGNPLVEEVRAYQCNPNFRQTHGLDMRPIIALLPGSRIQEVKRLLPMMLTLVPRFPAYQFVIAGISELPRQLYEVAQVHGVVVIKDQVHDILAHANMAVVKSGTATLETAYFNVPQVVVYTTDAFTYQVAKWLVKLKYISLVNILLQQEIVRELIQGQATPGHLFSAVTELLTDDAWRKHQQVGYENIKSLLGSQNASVQAAERIYAETIHK